MCNVLPPRASTAGQAMHPNSNRGTDSNSQPAARVCHKVPKGMGNQCRTHVWVSLRYLRKKRTQPQSWTSQVVTASGSPPRPIFPTLPHTMCIPPEHTHVWTSIKVCGDGIGTSPALNGCSLSRTCNSDAPSPPHRDHCTVLISEVSCADNGDKHEETAPLVWFCSRVQ